MGIKTKNNSGTGAHKGTSGMIAAKISKEFSVGKKRVNSLDPRLMPEKINEPKGKVIMPLINDTLDMKSKKLISNIDESITNLASLNPLEEGGFGYDHPAGKSKKHEKKNDKPFSQAEVTENIDEYAAMLLDLKMIMGKLGTTRKAIFASSSKKC